MDNLGNYLKSIEDQYTTQSLDKNLCVYARLDGRAFHSFVKKYRHSKPYDYRLQQTMHDTTEELVRDWNVDLSYVQSDEISLLWLPKENIESQFTFGGKIQKLTSTLASSCTNAFLRHYMNEFGFLPKASFDCRIMNLSIEDGFKMMYWRHVDCKKNAVSSYANSYFSNNELNGKKTSDRVNMLRSIGVDVQQDPSFLYGTFFIGFNYPQKCSINIDSMKTAQETMTSWTRNES